MHEHMDGEITQESGVSSTIWDKQLIAAEFRALNPFEMVVRSTEDGLFSVYILYFPGKDLFVFRSFQSFLV